MASAVFISSSFLSAKPLTIPHQGLKPTIFKDSTQTAKITKKPISFKVRAAKVPASVCSFSSIWVPSVHRFFFSFCWLQIKEMELKETCGCVWFFSGGIAESGAEIPSPFSWIY